MFRANRVATEEIEPQERRDKHDERDVEREACAGLVPVHGDNLVGVGEDGRHDDEERGHPGRKLHYPSHESWLHFVVVSKGRDPVESDCLIYSAW